MNKLEDPSLMSNARQQLALAKRELIEHCYVTGVRRGLHRPIVAVIDMTDDAGREYARSQIDEATIEERVGRCDRSGAGSVVIEARPRPATTAFDVRSSAYTVLSHTESGNVFAVVVISDGGISWAAFPIV